MKLFSAAKSAVKVECVVANPELLLDDECGISLCCGNLSPYSSIFNASASVVDVPKYKHKIAYLKLIQFYSFYRLLINTLSLFLERERERKLDKCYNVS